MKTISQTAAERLAWIRERETTSDHKKTLQAKLDKDKEAFFARGGKIEKVGTIIHSTAENKFKPLPNHSPATRRKLAAEQKEAEQS